VLLEGLASAQHEGVLQPTTVTGLFAKDPPGADGEPAVRTLSSSTVPPAQPGPSAAAVNSARHGVAAFSSLAPADITEVSTLDELILAGEASNLTRSERAALLGMPSGALASEGALVTLPEGRIVTLTSSTGEVPVTIESRSNIPLHVRVVLSNPKLGLRFPGGTSFSLVLSSRTTVEEVQVSSLTSGDFALRLDLVTPVGNMPIAHGSLTIRSTALSGLAIGLSVGALALLLVWWVRSSRRRRREPGTDANHGGGDDDGSPATGDEHVDVMVGADRSASSELEAGATAGGAGGDLTGDNDAASTPQVARAGPDTAGA
jgi:hypothetical protein